jgi:hypothetical protein
LLANLVFLIECAIGNDAFWLLGLHLYTPLPFFHKEEKLSSWLKTHTFLNMGNIFSVKNLSIIFDTFFNLFFVI